MKQVHFVVSLILVSCVCGRSDGQTNAIVPLVQARQGFKTKPTERGSAKEAVPKPPPDVFRTVRYDSPAGKLAAYLTPDPKDGKKHPAIIWIHGGNCNSIGEFLWRAAPASNDQTATAYRKAGITMMFPSLRGGNDNPGVREGFFGEVDDVLAAAEFLGQQAFVDPRRIYLGGHSTGGTLVLLVAECSDRFRAVFSFGPVLSAAWHQRQNVPFDISSKREVELRAPILWLQSIKSPVFVFEGTKSFPGNVQSLQTMAKACKNPTVRFCAVTGASHFSATWRNWWVKWAPLTLSRSSGKWKATSQFTSGHVAEIVTRAKIAFRHLRREARAEMVQCAREELSCPFPLGGLGLWRRNMLQDACNKAQDNFKQTTAQPAGACPDFGAWLSRTTEDLIMKRRTFAVGLAVVAVLGSAALLRGAQQEASNIEPKADQCLKAMSNYLAGLKTYSFQVEEFIDEVQDDGQKLQLSNQRHLSVSRPGKMFGESEGDTANSLFYYQAYIYGGQTVYLVVPAPF